MIAILGAWSVQVHNGGVQGRTQLLEALVLLTLAIDQGDRRSSTPLFHVIQPSLKSAIGAVALWYAESMRRILLGVVGMEREAMELVSAMTDRIATVLEDRDICCQWIHAAKNQSVDVVVVVTQAVDGLGLLASKRWATTPSVISGAVAGCLRIRQRHHFDFAREG